MEEEIQPEKTPDPVQEEHWSDQIDNRSARRKRAKIERQVEKAERFMERYSR